MLSKKNQPLLDGKYSIIETISEDGKTSIVYKVIDNETKEIKVAKIIRNEFLYIFNDELNNLIKINNFNLDSNIKLYYAGKGPFIDNGKNEQKCFFIFEYASHGTLFDLLIKTNDGFSEIVCKYILFELIKIISSLHKKGFCHRDLKIENILVVDKYIFKLGDFGFSSSFLDNNNNKVKLKGILGTIKYEAPEIIEGKPYDGEKVDIFSLGVILFVLMTKRFPFKAAKTFAYIQNESEKLYGLLINKKIEEYWKIIEKVYVEKILSAEFKKLFIKMVSYKPSERPSFEEILNSEWMKEIKDASKEYLAVLKDKMISEITLVKA